MNDVIIHQPGDVPDNYDPQEGLKSVAVAEAAEKHFARAKDTTKLMEAVEAKLGEQRRFVLWWDGQSSHGGDRRSEEFQNRSSANLNYEQFGIDKDTLSRWRKRLKDPKKFDVTLEAALARCVKVCEAKQGHSDHARATNTGENEWYTPPQYLELAREVLGNFDLDPASSAKAQETVRAGVYFTKRDDGLAQKWSGRIWLNPPYAQPLIADFVSKMVAERRAGHVSAAIMLVNDATDTAWFHEAAGACDAICFLRGRVRFLSKTGDAVSSPLQGQAFFYFGHDVERFAEVFGEVGFVARPA